MEGREGTPLTMTNTKPPQTTSWPRRISLPSFLPPQLPQGWTAASDSPLSVILSFLPLDTLSEMSTVVSTRPEDRTRTSREGVIRPPGHQEGVPQRPHTCGPARTASVKRTEQGTVPNQGGLGGERDKARPHSEMSLESTVWEMQEDAPHQIHRPEPTRGLSVRSFCPSLLLWGPVLRLGRGHRTDQFSHHMDVAGRWKMKTKGKEPGPQRSKLPDQVLTARNGRRTAPCTCPAAPLSVLRAVTLQLFAS